MTRERWLQVDRVFGAALECPPERQAAFLEKVCGSDSELRRLVERLLDAERSSRSSLEKPIVSTASLPRQP